MYILLLLQYKNYRVQTCIIQKTALVHVEYTSNISKMSVWEVFVYSQSKEEQIDK